MEVISVLIIWFVIFGALGYAEYNALENIDDWGKNLLGKIITELTEEIE